MSPQNDEEGYLGHRMQNEKPALAEGEREAAKASHPGNKINTLAYQQYRGCSHPRVLAKKVVDQVVWISLSHEDL